MEMAWLIWLSIKAAQIIKEEVEAYRVSQEPQIDESIDKETLDILKAVVKQTYQELTIPTDVDQTYADTGEPVSKDPEVMHEKAIEFIMSEVADILDKELESEVEMDLDEDGHDDVPSAVRAMKTMAEDALEMLDALEQMDGNLPTWWTNKMAVSASMLNKMRDYLLVPSVEEDIDEQWPEKEAQAGLEEKTLTKPEKKEKEKVVKGMKKNKSDFKKRYGKDAESVMYATATNIAKEKA